MSKYAFDIVCPTDEVKEQVTLTYQTLLGEYQKQPQAVRLVVIFEASWPEPSVMHLVVDAKFGEHDMGLGEKAASRFASVFSRVGATVKEVGKVG